MTAGALREQVTILRPVVVSDGLGGQSRTFEAVETVWASVLPTRPGDLEPVADAAAGVQGYRIRVRFREDVSIDNRVDWRGKRLNVMAAADMDGKRAYTLIFTDAGVVTD